MGDFNAFEEKMRKADLSQAAIDAFRLNYEQLVAGVTGLVSCRIFSIVFPSLLSAARVNVLLPVPGARRRD